LLPLMMFFGSFRQWNEKTLKAETPLFDACEQWNAFYSSKYSIWI